jgi:hypothetical protein
MEGGRLSGQDWPELGFQVVQGADADCDAALGPDVVQEGVLLRAQGLAGLLHLDGEEDTEGLFAPVREPGGWW